MFLKAICDDEPCMVNTDFIIEVYDLEEKVSVLEEKIERLKGEEK